MEVGDRVFGKITYVSSSGFTVVWEIPGFSMGNAGQSKLDKFRTLLVDSRDTLCVINTPWADMLIDRIDKALKD